MRVSCLMVTLPVPGRRAAMLRTIGDYARQTHAARELVVVIDGGHGGDPDTAAAAIVALGRTDVRIVRPAGTLSLGALRNIAVGAASGDVVCQWDDDDRHHPDRIAAQLAAMGAASATLLADVMIHRIADCSLRWTNWAATPAGGHPATLLCRRRAMPPYPEAGPKATLGEDLAVATMLAGSTAHVAGAPQLYVYVDHGANSSPPAHHAMLARTLSISAGLLRRREAALRAGLAPFAFETGTIAVEGNNGAAFTL